MGVEIPFPQRVVRNTDYDLYSSGPDGASVGPLTAKASRDDILRANNGRFVGPASAY
jgi:general secretion pathway protein G